MAYRSDLVRNASALKKVRNPLNGGGDAKEEFKNLEMYQAIEARAEILATEKWMKKQGDLKSLN